MPESDDAAPCYAELAGRLDEIVDAVADEDLPLDGALDLYEEAVKLGMQASELLEQGIREHDAAHDAQMPFPAEGTRPADGLDAATTVVASPLQEEGTD